MSSKPVHTNTSTKKNFLYNLLNTVSGILFPLISFPYASRILLAEGTGQVDFFSAIISYITLFTSLGIPLYAVREIAKVRNNEKELSKVAVEILLLHICLSFFGYLIVILLASWLAEIQVDIPLFLLLSSSILLTAIGGEWFYRGIEDFKYITIRSLLVRSVSLVLLFLLVKTREDIMWYAAYTVFGVFGGNIFNFFRFRKLINFRSFRFRELSPLTHLKPAMHVFLLNLIASVYIYLNTVMLGFMTNNETVGYYTRATKITQIVLSIVTSLSIVMIPRLSHLIASGKKEEFNRMAAKSINFIVALSLPLMVGLVIMAPTIVHILLDPSFEPTILTLQILAPIVFVIALSNVIGIQILYPQGQENKVIISTLVGAVVNLVLNFFLIPRMAQNGAAIATVIAECSVTLTQIIIGAAFIPVKIFNKSYINYVIASIMMGIGLYLVSLFRLSDSINILVTPVVGVAIYFTYLYFRKDRFYMEVINSLKEKISRRKRKT